MQIHPSVQRFTSLKQRLLQSWPPDRDGFSMNLEGVRLDDKVYISSGSRVDGDPATTDLIDVSTHLDKGGSRNESFIETQEGSLWDLFTGAPSEKKLYHLARTMSHSSSGYHLADVVLTEISLNSGKEVSRKVGKEALKQARQIEDQRGLRLYLQPES